VKKPVLIGVMIAMVLAVSAPALTQTAPNDIEASPVQDTEAVQTSGDASVDPALTPTPAPTPVPAPVPSGPTVGCGVLYNDPAATCPVDASGNVALPNGSTAPVLVRPDGSVFIQDASGALTLIGQGASFITTGIGATGGA
jgi:hypothetical protein